MWDAALAVDRGDPDAMWKVPAAKTHAVDVAIANPLLLIGSDALPFTTGGEHPRGAGNFSRVLGHYVREKKALLLMDALAKMTWRPAARKRKPSSTACGRTANCWSSRGPNTSA